MSCVSWCDYDGELPDKVDPDSRLVSWEVTLGTFSDWFRDQALGILEYQTPVIPTQLYVAAHSTASDPTAAGTELSGDNYFRTPITFERVSDIQVRNAAPATTQLATGDWDNILSFSLWDDPTGGNFYAFGNLVQPLAITAGRGIQFPAQNVTVGIGAAIGATGQLSNWYINKILKVFLLQTPVVPTQLQIGAHSTVSTAETAGTELSGSNYSRTDLTLSTANSRLRWNTSVITSAAASANWDSILSYSILDGVGNYYGYQNITALSILSGESISWAINGIQIGLGGVTFNDTSGSVIGQSFDPQTPLGKPRYTPEPPVESMEPAARAYYRRELERISDLWPKDYGRRIAALESLVPYATGVWPIVDGAFVTFERFEFSLNCSNVVTTYNTGETRALFRATGLSVHGNRIVVSRLGGSSNVGIIGTWDIDSETWTARYTSDGTNGSDVCWHRRISEPGTVGQNDHVLAAKETFDFVNGIRKTLYVVRVSDWTSLSSVSLIGDVFIEDDSPNKVAFSFANGNVICRSKTSLNTFNTINEPTGWTFVAMFWSTAESQWMLLYSENATSDLGWSFVAETYSGAAPTPSKTKLTALSGQSWTISSEHWRDGNDNIYFEGTSTTYKNTLNPVPPNATFIIKIDNAGNLEKIYDYYDTANVDASTISGSVSGESTGLSNEANMQYHAPSNASYGTLGQLMIKHDIASDTWSTCTLTALSAETFYGRMGTDNTVWHAYRAQEPTQIRLLNSEIF